MTRTRSAIAVALAFVAMPGCLTMYSKTEVVRGDEMRCQIAFESPDASSEFYKAIEKQNGTLGETYVGVPFITLYMKRQELSDAAAWNDAVTRCDINRDGVITLDEAKNFAKSISH